MAKYKTLTICSILYLFSALVSMIVLYFILDTVQFSLLDVDERFYYSEAEKIVDGVYAINTYRPIAYVLFLAPILLVTGKNLIATQVVVTLISCLKVPLTYLLAKKIVNSQKVGAVSAIVVSLWPVMAFYTLSLYSESVVIPLFLVFLLLLQPSFFSGFLLALCSFFHPMFICFFPFALVLFTLEKKLKFVPYFILGLVITILPWSLTASLSEGSFVLLSKNGMGAMVGGTNPKLIEKGNYDYLTPEGRRAIGGPGLWSNDTGFLTAEEKKLTQSERNKLLLPRMVHWALENPKDFLFLEAVKVTYLWGIYPFRLSNPMRIIFGNIPILIVIVLSILSLIKFRRKIVTFCPLWILPLFVSSVALISCGSWRYRQVGDIGLIILSSLYFCSFFDKTILRKQ